MQPHTRKQALEALLLAHVELWRPQPFKDPQPAWCEIYPALAAEALATPESELVDRAADGVGLIRWVARHVPGVDELLPLVELPPSPVQTVPPLSAHLATHVPGRKRAQVAAFAAALGRPRAELLEWCAGLGHLGRHLAAGWALPVTSLEIDPALCARGEALGAAYGQRFIQTDVLADTSAAWLRARHVVALHACGELHRRLVLAAAAVGCPALDLAPCCYHRTPQPTYRPLSGGTLRLDADALRLAVTDTVTAGAAERRRSFTAMARKLAFQSLARAVSGRPYHPLKPVPTRWLALDFEAWCRRLAAREGLRLPTSIDWQALRREGERLALRVRRLELVRLAFRRALEVWLASDLAAHLAQSGYRVRLQTFCPATVTPRNLLISARRD